MWKGFQRPKRLEYERETLTDRFGRFYAQPFERGFGTTIGNALRRVLLSSIEGAAITAVKIDGVLHEFSPIPGVVEDATDIILNLKQIPLMCHVDHIKTLYLRVDKAGEVRARDIEADADIEILEPDAHIATVSEGGKLHMELRIKRGRGYVSADKNFDEDLGIGWIPIDSVHSPVKKVNYLVEAARLGQTTDYDKLTLDVWTNGSVTPNDAVSLAAKRWSRPSRRRSADRRRTSRQARRCGRRRTRDCLPVVCGNRAACPRQRAGGACARGVEVPGRARADHRRSRCRGREAAGRGRC
jgi:DNA-directed RNA polymerase subunit alpha